MIKKFKLFENLFSESDSDFIKLQEIIEDSLIDNNVIIRHNISTDIYDNDDLTSEYTSSVIFTIYFRNVSSKITVGNPYSDRIVDYDTIIINVDGYQKVSTSINSLLHRLKKSKYSLNYFNRYIR
jgi:hypothetical protein